jgi:DNA segregation ATPase FtsK/SpoIIIE-like protein
MSERVMPRDDWFEPHFREHSANAINDHERPERPQYAALLGIDGTGKPVTASLAGVRAAPHLLIAGATGSGKSYLMHLILVQLLLQYGPSDLRLAVIDRKRVGVGIHYGRVPHLFAPVASEHSDAIALMKLVHDEMERRYKLLEAAEANSLEEYNESHEPLPHILLALDEVADFTDGDDEATAEAYMKYVGGIARKGRAAGIMLLLSLQRPGEESLDEHIRNNLTQRIALRLFTAGESEMILGKEAGDAATRLSPRGDAIYYLDGERTRLQTLFMPIRPEDRQSGGEGQELLADYLEKIAARWSLRPTT